MPVIINSMAKVLKERRKKSGKKERKRSTAEEKPDILLPLSLHTILNASSEISTEGEEVEKKEKKGKERVLGVYSSELTFPFHGIKHQTREEREEKKEEAQKKKNKEEKNSTGQSSSYKYRKYNPSINQDPWVFTRKRGNFWKDEKEKKRSHNTTESSNERASFGPRRGGGEMLQEKRKKGKRGRSG